MCCVSRLLQVISQFATISSDAGASSYPEPAATFVRTLSATNFAILGFIPLGCIAGSMTFYDKTAFQVSAPLVIIALFWCYPLYNWLLKRPSDMAVTKAKERSLLLLELVLPSIATSLVQVFGCTEFDDGSFLAESLTLACDDSDERVFWVLFAGISLTVYILGGAFGVRFIKG